MAEGHRPLTSEKAGYTPYRFAGKHWWTDDYTLAGVNPDRARATGKESGFESYDSVIYKRFARDNPGAEPPTSLPTDNSHAIVAQSGLGALYTAEVFNRWAQDMTGWAKAVRDDLLRIENKLGLPHGDPGDPPPVPWK